MASKEKLAVKPSKVVAGHEPQQTNELLQAIGRILENRQSTPSGGAGDGGVEKKVEAVASNKISTRRTTIAAAAAKSTDRKESMTKKKETKKKPILSKDGRDTNKLTVAKIPKQKIVADEDIKESASNTSVEMQMVSSTATLSLKENDVVQLVVNNELTFNDEHIGEPITHDDVPADFSGELGKLESVLDETSSTNEPFKITSSSSATKRRQITENSKQSSVADDEKENEAEAKASTDVVETSSLPPPPPPSTNKKVRKISKISAEPTKERNSEQNLTANPNETPVLQTAAAIVDPLPIPPPTSAAKNKTDEEVLVTKNVIRPRTSLRPPSVRPASARPGAPRRRDRNVDIVLAAHTTDALSATAAAAQQMKMNSFDVDDDEDDNFIIIEDPTLVVVTNDNVTTSMANDATELSAEQQQGHLVRQILDTQKDFRPIDPSAAAASNVEAATDDDNEMVSYIGN